MAVYEKYKSDLAVIERKLVRTVQSQNRDLQAASTQLITAGGKRIRPLFAVLCSQFGKASPDRVHTVAAALELVHMATLVHDDVIDDADLRRGRPTGPQPIQRQGSHVYRRFPVCACHLSIE